MKKAYRRDNPSVRIEYQMNGSVLGTYFIIFG